MSDISVLGKNWVSKKYNDQTVNFLKDNYNLESKVFVDTSPEIYI